MYERLIYQNKVNEKDKTMVGHAADNCIGITEREIHCNNIIFSSSTEKPPGGSAISSLLSLNPKQKGIHNNEHSSNVIF